jgi:hypothetical protein
MLDTVSSETASVPWRQLRLYGLAVPGQVIQPLHETT